MTNPAKRALITGGGSGIGLAIAQKFVKNGINVTIAGRNTARLKETGLAFIEIDVTDETSVIEAVKQCGPIDIFIANAGAATTAPALKTSHQLWDEMIAVNLTSVYLCARAAIPQMVDRGWGRFIAIASTASLKAYAYTGAYTAAKHGVIGWVRTLAIELAKTGVTSNAICPGFTDTAMVQNSIEAIAQKTGRTKDQALQALVKDNPMGRLIKPVEVAQTALWLASDDAAAINGQAIAVDAGETAS